MDDQHDYYPCPLCNGDGKTWKYEMEDLMYIHIQEDCERCEGMGQLKYE